MIVAGIRICFSVSVITDRCFQQIDRQISCINGARLALNHRNLREAGYATIQELLLRRGYELDLRQPFIFHPTVVLKGNPVKVEVDFLAGEYEGTRPYHRTQLVQEGLRKIAEKFASPEHVGPKFVADSDEIYDPEERALRTRDAFEPVNYLLAALGVR